MREGQSSVGSPRLPQQRGEGSKTNQKIPFSWQSGLLWSPAPGSLSSSLGVFPSFSQNFFGWLPPPLPLLGRSTQLGWVAQRRSQRSHEGMAQHFDNCRAGFCFPLQGLVSPALLTRVLSWLSRQKVFSGLVSGERRERCLHWVTWHLFGRKN